VIGISQLMALAGLSMALGAFLAGVLLASSEYRHALETDLEPFKGLLLGLFFISVGMSIDFGLLRDALLTAQAVGDDLKANAEREAELIVGDVSQLVVDECVEGVRRGPIGTRGSKKTCNVMTISHS